MNPTRLIRRDVFPLILALLGVFSFRSSIAEPYRVPTGSMKPSIQPGDYLLVSKLAYELRLPFSKLGLARTGTPQRGDVIVFDYPLNPSIAYVKRLIGLPGDHVEVSDGNLRINGVSVPLESLPTDQLTALAASFREEPRFRGAATENLDSHPHAIQRLVHFPSGTQEFDVPPGHYFFMGDNRDDSNDSRFWGFVPEVNLRGKALGVYLSVNFDRGLFPEIRWQRIGTRL